MRIETENKGNGREQEENQKEQDNAIYLASSFERR
jgi:hypothetical protein